jgi:deazaflavin-dependent oxidoreductase (nitroreductase family)
LVFSDRFLAWFTATLPDFGVRFSGKLQAQLYRLSGGRIGGRFGRGPVLVLTTTGRKSGQPRTTTVLYAKDGDRLVVVGSNTGSEQPPAWALNLAATPRATVQIGRQRRQVRATELGGRERERLWELMNDLYGGFERYTHRTDREFKVFALEPE